MDRWVDGQMNSNQAGRDVCTGGWMDGWMKIRLVKMDGCWMDG